MTKQQWQSFFDTAEAYKENIVPNWYNNGDCTAEAVGLAQLEFGIIDALPIELEDL